ncbi:MAG: D-glycero-beta-D-manno-heptose 1,7-bisphosphate 7-phosphatase [Gammaproteobacteria bacterium]|nr:D-glycero-beta-D-manno-heptose 1,7-bisphosphate 7-phosphatase [Gammaproteobacteria bacterium]
MTGAKLPKPPLKLVVLDRDGVINADSPDYIKSPDEWRPLAGSLGAIAQLTQAGFDIVVASNQSGVGRGLFDQKQLDAIQDKMRTAIGSRGGHLDAIYVCPHHPDDKCDCRKPKPGLLRQIETDRGISLHGVPVIGDSARDLDAARAVGAWPMLVLTGNGEATARSYPELATVDVFDDLAAAAAALIEAIRE